VAEANRDVERIYRSLALIRRVEEELARIYPSDRIKSPVHLVIGQEAVPVGVCDVLRPDDVVGGTYRSHGVYLAKGGDLNAMVAELFGKVTGCARGKGGSMHLVFPGAHVLGSSAVVATGIPLAAGHALALKREGRGRVAVAFFGDGATEEGCFYETLNFAALHRLPLFLVCENNGLAIHQPLHRRWASLDLCTRVAAFGVPAQRIEDGDVMAIRAAAAAALARTRAGEGPEFLECLTYRWREHVGPDEDFDQGYRDRAELEPWLARDPVETLGARLPPSVRTEIDVAIAAEIAAAVNFATRSPFPESSELERHVLG
jgi:pyruvate dehydrogenase E1 component alpha subunit